MSYTYILCRSHVAYVSHLLGNHTQLLKVDKAIDLRVISEVNEGQIFLDNREERDLERNINIKLCKEMDF